jgi:hypothetical protein
VALVRVADDLTHHTLLEILLDGLILVHDAQAADTKEETAVDVVEVEIEEVEVDDVEEVEAERCQHSTRQNSSTPILLK